MANKLSPIFIVGFFALVICAVFAFSFVIHDETHTEEPVDTAGSITGITVSAFTNDNTLRAYLSCVEDPSTHLFYCFGGEGHKDIFAYDTETANIIPKSAAFSGSRSYLGCAHSSATNKIYCLGGRGKDDFTDEIVEYDPETDKLLIMKERLPSPRAHYSCVENSDTKKIYCVTGSYEELYNDVIEYDPVEHRVRTKEFLRLHDITPRYQAMCAEDSSTNIIYCFGGADNTEKKERFWTRL